MLFMTLFFESVCFPTIVALGIRGLGKDYKKGSGFIIAGVSGGAAITPLLGHVADMHNDTALAMVVPVAVRSSLPPHLLSLFSLTLQCLGDDRRMDIRCCCQLCAIVP